MIHLASKHFAPLLSRRTVSALRSSLRSCTPRSPLSTLAQNQLEQFQVGRVVHGFRVVQVKPIPDFDQVAVRLKHIKTNADYLHVFKDDANNVFSVAFQTAPRDSTGVPHILEHTTLCGSEKYPVRDPFFKMLNRSMATFMNAMTGSDVTIYPFSTENKTDFYNLMDVYMDSTLAPRLQKFDFLQEGWRLEHQDPRDASTPIVFKGVVYNEMKGALSDMNSLFAQRLQQYMYPSTTYSTVSGGDPIEITDLTHEQLVDFHHKNYHPSNAKFFTYGTFPLVDHLSKIDASISVFEKIQPEQLNDTERWSKPRKMIVSSVPDALAIDGRESKVAISYLVNDSNDIFETFVLRVICSLLTEGAASPMYKSLIESDLGTDYVMGSGYDSTARLAKVSFGLQGIRSEDAPRVEDAIQNTLADAAQHGFDAHRVESVIHQMELGLKHRTANFGMGLAQAIIGHWIHGGDPIEAMEFSKYIDQLRREAATPGFFESRIRRYFIDNPHRLTLVMQPEESFVDEQEQEEANRLERKLAALTKADKAQIYSDGIELLKKQEETEDLSCLPTLTVKDISPQGKTYPPKHASVAGLPVQWRTTDTNRVSYVNLAKSLLRLPEELKSYLPLFCMALGKTGTTNKSLAELDEQIRLLTGGIEASYTAHASPQSLTTSHEDILVATSSLSSNISSSYDLLCEVIQNTNWHDTERLMTNIRLAQSNYASSIVENGHGIAMSWAEATMTRASWLNELTGGFSQAEFLNSLAAKSPEDIQGVSDSLKRISEFVLNESETSRAAVVLSPQDQPTHERQLIKLVDRLKLHSNAFERTGAQIPFVPKYRNTLIALPYPINFAAQTFLGVPLVHKDSPSLQILASLMTTHFLHREIREKGGAYGGGARYSALDGTFSFYSYRDPPGAKRTLDAFESSINWAVDIRKSLGQRELDEAKLSIFSQVDSPVNAGDESMTLFKYGVTDHIRQSRREQLFAVTLDEVELAAQTYLLEPLRKGHSSKTVLGDRREAEGVEGWTIVDSSAGGEY
ncbi:presequence protease [Polychytrium aggregatum]|uniref:presequence protease n=1 Tax=Polychytrium aggregatum TaxID=110093 RepID=UPI0022FDC55A|nr:presequence protease [Polychytrium aggregatum]KAI9205690.1 presequence protease [Polychytrium aggregatum]